MLFLFLVRTYVLGTYQVSAASMEPTLHCASDAGCRATAADKVLVDRVVYRLREPRRGEVVVFHLPAGFPNRCGGARTYIKRVIALPGERIAQVRGRIYVNGQGLAEPYTSGRADESFAPVRIPDDHYFVMGDNREASCDSRNFGPVAHGDLIGRALLIYAPLARIRLLR